MKDRVKAVVVTNGKEFRWRIETHDLVLASGVTKTKSEARDQMETASYRLIESYKERLEKQNRALRALKLALQLV